MSIRSGSWSNSLNVEMQGAAVCSDTEKKVPRMVAGPDNHGSTRMVKEVGKRGGEAWDGRGGSKVSRKAVSALRDLTVRDMFAREQVLGKKDTCRQLSLMMCTATTGGRAVLASATIAVR